MGEEDAKLGHFIELGRVKPWRGRVLVENVTLDEQEQGSGIFVVKKGTRKHSVGKVIKVAPGRINDDGYELPVEVQEGDYVVYLRPAGSKLTGILTDKYEIVRQIDLECIIEDPDDFDILKR